MGLETSTYLDGLDSSWPLGGDGILQGDDHLRLLKSVLKATFPGSGGNGFEKAITATEDEINYLAGATSNIQSQINSINASDALTAPSGTVLTFFQASPPTGWTQVATHDDKMLRVVSGGTGGNSGGSDSPISWDSSHTHTTQAHTLTEAEIPSHTHDYLFGNSGGGAGPFALNLGQGFTGTTQSTGGGGSHTHGDTGSSGGTFTPKYINIMMASKD